jgi:predicted nucleic acid-binding protein
MPDNLFHLSREKILLDTSVYISHLTHGRHIPSIGHLIRNHVFYLHSVVFEELLAGIKTSDEKNELLRLKKPFLAANRLITPHDGDWQETGLLINRLITKSALPPHKAVSLTHDVLIAISSARLGIRVITENKKDFERIRHLKPFKFSILKSS